MHQCATLLFIWSGGSIAIQIHSVSLHSVTFCVQCSEGPVQFDTVVPTGRVDHRGSLGVVSDHCIDCTVHITIISNPCSIRESSRRLRRAPGGPQVDCPGRPQNLQKFEIFKNFIFFRYRLLVDSGAPGGSLGIGKRSLECSNDCSQSFEDLPSHRRHQLLPSTAVITTVGQLRFWSSWGRPGQSTWSTPGRAAAGGWARPRDRSMTWW